ncbi:MAG: hypothetical protein A2161_00775 [Candidatus Schekmanbacteria bacterium RBG_13_48_7]|uniref:dolichyl-phosphate beta-glucosyltransferase n=1 Tax=Candidatus Schekmanbacteria bacterium RBG_13_48_7 TaxID=1817878 RepID=A0A1F7RUA0_9BACT|nr:MAG: hypothetical protein A2161_00775 [Candidatus Schekmanbacteria bacterium RBG_13_48_7]
MLSIIIPAYNEEDRIGPTLLQILDLVKDSGLKIEIVVVDDGSIDNTRDRVLNISDRYNNLRLISHKNNRGKGAAIRTGVLNARGSKILYTDADFSYPVTRLAELIGKLENHDVIIGSRTHPDSRMIVPPPVYRKWLAFIFSFMVRILLGLPFLDTQCGFKGFKTEIAIKLFRLARIDGFSFDAEILTIAHLHGYSICEIPVSLVHSFGSRLSLFKDAIIMAVDIVRIRYNIWKGYYNETTSGNLE